MNNKIKNIFFRNFFNLSVNQLLNIVFTILITHVLFQRIEAENFGLVNLYFTIVMIVSVIVGYGYNINAPKRLASSNNNEIQDLINEITSTRIYLGIFLFLLCLISSFFFTSNSTYGIFTFSLIIILSEAINPFFYFQGTDRLTGLIVSNIFIKTFYLLLIILLVNSKNDALLVNLLFGFSCLIVHMSCWIYIYLENNFKFSFSKPKMVFHRLNENIYFTLSALSGYLSINSALIILSVFVSNIELGKFSVAQKIGLFLRMVPVFITQSILQEASRKFLKSKKNYSDFIRNTYRKGLLFTFFLAILISFFSKWIVYLLTGEFIIYSEIILSILSFVPFFSMLNFKNMVSIIVNERKKILNKTSWYTVFFTFISGAVLSYLYGGLGMAISLLFSEIINYFFCNYYLKNEE